MTLDMDNWIAAHDVVIFLLLFSHLFPRRDKTTTYQATLVHLFNDAGLDHQADCEALRCLAEASRGAGQLASLLQEPWLSGMAECLTRAKAAGKSFLYQDLQRAAFWRPFRYLKPTKKHPFEGTGRLGSLHLDTCTCMHILGYGRVFFFWGGRVF